MYQLYGSSAHTGMTLNRHIPVAKKDTTIQVTGIKFNTIRHQP